MKKLYSKILFNILIIFSIIKNLMSGNVKASNNIDIYGVQFGGERTAPISVPGISTFEKIANGTVLLILSPVLLISIILLGTYSFYKITRRKFDNQSLYLADGLLGLILFFLSYFNIQKIQETANITDLQEVLKTIGDEKTLILLTGLNLILVVWFVGFLIYIIFSALSNKKLRKIDEKNS